MRRICLFLDILRCCPCTHRPHCTARSRVKDSKLRLDRILHVFEYQQQQQKMNEHCGDFYHFEQQTQTTHSQCKEWATNEITKKKNYNWHDRRLWAHARARLHAQFRQPEQCGRISATPQTPITRCNYSTSGFMCCLCVFWWWWLFDRVRRHAERTKQKQNESTRWEWPQSDLGSRLHAHSACVCVNATALVIANLRWTHTHTHAFRSFGFSPFPESIDRKTLRWPVVSRSKLSRITIDHCLMCEQTNITIFNRIYSSRQLVPLCSAFRSSGKI